MSSCGFDPAARELVDRRADRTLILVEPNDAGGWSVTGPVQVKALADLFDPEVDTDKRRGFTRRSMRRGPICSVRD